MSLCRSGLSTRGIVKPQVRAKAGFSRSFWWTNWGSAGCLASVTPRKALNMAKKHLAGRPAKRGGVTPGRSVSGRMEIDGVWHGASWYSSGAFSSNARLPPVDWSVAMEIDPPADRIDRVAFCARSLADDLHQRLDREGIACVRIAIEAETEYGETFLRLWRHEGALSAAAIADRVRWQLDGWLNGSAAARPSGGIARVALIPDEIVPARGRQLGFWGGETEVDERAARVAARLQGQLGADAVLVPEHRGGRHAEEQLTLVPASTVELRGRRLREDDEEAPWPGRLPAPSPSRVPADPGAAELLDDQDRMVTVTGRGLPSASPATLVIGRHRHEITGWAGPWPVDERWWDTDEHRRRARFQVLSDDGHARLLTLERGRWWITAIWD